MFVAAKVLLILVISLTANMTILQVFIHQQVHILEAFI